MLSINFYCPRWGAEKVPWDLFSTQVKNANFDGVEVYPLQTPIEKSILLKSIEDNGLEFSLLHAEMIEGVNIEKYKEALTRNLYELVNYQTNTLKPQFITTQTGREYYSEVQMAECFEICDRISNESGILIIQETHRNKWSYAAHVVKDYLQKFPTLKLALDISHWFCVSESYLEDQQEAIDLAIKHTAHLHARIGHMEGPQVTDPRAPENEEALIHHLRCWDKWIAHLRESNISKCTITPEFGPSPYMAHQINTKTPIASQWEINCFMKDLLRNRYKTEN